MNKLQTLRLPQFQAKTYLLGTRSNGFSFERNRRNDLAQPNF
jgi:hypothetical protein